MSQQILEEISKKNAQIYAVEYVKNQIIKSKTVEEAVKLVEEDLDSTKNALKEDLKQVDAEDHKIEYETLEIKVPKKAIEFLIKIGEDPKEWIEYKTLETIKANIEGMNLDGWYSAFGLTEVFKSAGLIHTIHFEKEQV